MPQVGDGMDNFSGDYVHVDSRNHGLNNQCQDVAFFHPIEIISLDAPDRGKHQALVQLIFNVC